MKSIEILSAFFTIVSMFPYAIGIYRGVIIANSISWGIWSFIGFIFFFTTYTNPLADRISIIFSLILLNFRT